jgi:hypothetical protein
VQSLMGEMFCYRKWSDITLYILYKKSVTIGMVTMRIQKTQGEHDKFLCSLASQGVGAGSSRDASTAINKTSMAVNNLSKQLTLLVAQSTCCAVAQKGCRTEREPTPSSDSPNHSEHHEPLLQDRELEHSREVAPNPHRRASQRRSSRPSTSHIPHLRTGARRTMLSGRCAHGSQLQ